ncbi:conserved hypothetical protein [metagenome]|uniref:Uncharacterized protein n=1 Tax=metagenome TaxID=256318 RepID=A0A2P2C1B8_9ZZZZ
MSIRERFEDYTDRLLRSVSAYDEVEGLVLLGSTAATERVDAWSDHDFYLVVAPGTEEHFRTDLAWLPDQDQIGFSARETEHGLKVVYRSGQVLEFAVANASDLTGFGGSPFRVVLDRTTVTERMAAARVPRPGDGDDLADLRIFLALLVIGVGRAARGEELVAGELLRVYAVRRLTDLLRRHAEPVPGVSADPYNPLRRFESAYPRWGRTLGEVLAQPATQCGRSLLDLADAELAPRWPGYPQAEADLTRAVIGQSQEGHEESQGRHA